MSSSTFSWAVSRKYSAMASAVSPAASERRPPVSRLANSIEKPPEHCLSHRHADGRARATHACATPQPRCAFERHGARCSGVEMLMDLRDKGPAEIPLDRNGFVDGRQSA